MTWAPQRLGVNEIKNHPFFYGADWDNLRYIAPPFVPALSSITDTTYFPTDELNNLPEQLESVEKVGSDKDLAFLGCVDEVDVICTSLSCSCQIHFQAVHLMVTDSLLSFAGIVAFVD